MTLKVGAARRRAQEARGEYVPPERPPGAAQFVAGDAWRWASVQPGLPESARWEPLVARLCAASPWQLLEVRYARAGELTEEQVGVTQPRYAPGGSTWCRVLIRPGMSADDTERALRHELGHVAHLAAVGETA